MYILKLHDKQTGRVFEVKLDSPYLVEQWKKKHKIPYSKRLVLVSERREW